MALIDVSRATELVPNFNNGDIQVMTDCVDAASDIIETWCNRTFAVTTYDELYDGCGHRNLLLNNYPVISIQKVAKNPFNVVQIQNQVQSNTTCTVRLDETNLYLTTVNASNPSMAAALELPRADYTTLQSLSDGINSIGGPYGWQSYALGTYNLWPVSDLYAPQGALDARWGTAYLWMHILTLFIFDFNPLIGEIVSPQGFERGYRNFRIQYTAGFADSNGNTLIPTPVQQACAELAAATYLARNVNANLNAESLGEYSYTNIAEKSFKNLSATAMQGLAQYKNQRVPKFKLFS